MLTSEDNIFEPLVTIRTPVYNTGEYVIRGLETVKAQNYSNIQHIIIDDASQDNSYDLIKDWINKNNYKCTLIRHPKNKGLVYTMQEFNELATGKYMTGLADDLWFPYRLKEQVRIMEEAGENCALVYSDMKEIDEDDNIIKDSYFKSKGFYTKNMPHGKVPVTQFLKKKFIPAPSIMLRMKCLEAVGGYDQNLYTEDYDMWLKLLQKYEIQYSPKPFVLYRRRATSMSRTKGKEIRESHLKMFVKYLGSFGREGDVILLSKIIKDIIYLYRKNGNMKLCFETINTIQEKHFILKLFMLKLYIKMNLSKRIIRRFF